VDKIPTCRFEELPLSAEIVDSARALVTRLAKSNHKKVVFGDPLPVHMDDMVEALTHGSANALRKLKRGPIPISLNGSGRHLPNPALQRRIARNERDIVIQVVDVSVSAAATATLFRRIVLALLVLD
jgi:hypothetical protein